MSIPIRSSCLSKEGIRELAEGKKEIFARFGVKTTKTKIHEVAINALKAPSSGNSGGGSGMGNIGSY